MQETNLHLVSITILDLCTMLRYTLPPSSEFTPGDRILNRLCFNITRRGKVGVTSVPCQFEHLAVQAVVTESL